MKFVSLNKLPFCATTGKFDLNKSVGLSETDDIFVPHENGTSCYRRIKEQDLLVVRPEVQSSENSQAGRLKSDFQKDHAKKIAKVIAGEKVVPDESHLKTLSKVSVLNCQMNESLDECSREETDTLESVHIPPTKHMPNQKRVGVSAGSTDDIDAVRRYNRDKGTIGKTSSGDPPVEFNFTKHEKSQESEELIKRAIMQNEFLRKGLGDKEVLQAVVDAMYMEKKEENSYVIKEEEIGSHLYVCAEGMMEVIKGGKKVNAFGPGRIFGELALLCNTRRNATIKAITPCTIWVLDRNVFNQIIKRVGMRRIEEYVRYLRGVPLLSKLETEVLIKMTDLLKASIFPAGTPIIKQGEVGNLFYIITFGTVVVTVKNSDGSEKTITELEKGEFFGERALIAKDKRTATVTAVTNVECLTLDREPFIEILGGLEEVQRVNKTRMMKLKDAKEKAFEYSYIRLLDLEVKGTLGIGGFGRVELVQYKKNRKLTFALKCLKKSHIVSFQQQHHVLNEKKTMMCCQSPFIAKLYNTYKDAKYLYFLMEACLGGDVWSLLQKRGFFDDRTAKFIAGCVVEAFNYLHDRGIVYRDLKPENLLFNAKGYVKLVDFGFAKKLNPAEKAWTFAGTPEYLAPEIIHNKGHDRAVDYWALGVFIYEILVGKPPFRGTDTMTTYSLIFKGIASVPFPKFIKSAETLIKKLCKQEPTERLGYQKEGIDAIKRHRWFADFNWVSLQETKMKAPFVPKLNGPTDLSYFQECPKDKEIPPDMFGDWDKEF